MMKYLLLYFSVMTFNVCFKCVLILVFFRFPKKMTMAQLRHLEIGIDATAASRLRVSIRGRPYQNFPSQLV